MKANDRQVGGDHYRRKEGVMQHWDYAWAKGFDPFQYQITKYVERWREKNGVQDLEKALHFLEKYIELVKDDDQRTKELLEVREAVPHMRHSTSTNFIDESIAAHTDRQDRKPLTPKRAACRWCGKIFDDKFSTHAIGCPGIGKEESQNADGAYAPLATGAAPGPVAGSPVAPHKAAPGRRAR